ncbi:MAG: hypothetical protein R2744_08955 [Bacteroidales bacterium]
MGYSREANVTNAHPHASFSGNLVMVHNGIIENSDEIKEILARNGYSFVSETDTEVLLNLIDYEYLKSERIYLEALIRAQETPAGASAIVLLEKDRPENSLSAGTGSPLVLGLDNSGCYTASDIYAISLYARRFIFPENGDIIFVNASGIKEAHTSEGEIKSLVEKRYALDERSSGKNGYDHYMMKEICEQPSIAGSLLSDGLTIESSKYTQDEIDEILKGITGITFPWVRYLMAFRVSRKIPGGASGAAISQYRVCLWNTGIAIRGIPAGNLVISISQSGETADTIAANSLAAESGQSPWEFSM